MTAAWDVQFDNVWYSLSDGSLCWVVGHDGMGQNPSHRIWERGPLQHGVTDLGFRHNPRVVTLILGVQGTTAIDLETRLERLLDIFKASDSAFPIRLRRTQHNGNQRQIDLFYLEDMSLSTDFKRGFFRRVAITTIAQEPFFYDPTEQIYIFPIDGGSGAFEVPLEVPVSVGQSSIDDTDILTYAGTAREYPILVISGPMSSFTITNTSTGDAIELEGAETLGNGDEITIDLRYGAKTVIDQTGANVREKFTEDSDIATFHIGTSPKVPGKLNALKVVATGITSESDVRLRYYNRYVGIGV